MAASVFDLVVFSGSTDASLKRLVDRARSRGARVDWLVYDRPGSLFTYDPSANRLEYNGRDVNARAAMYRMDVYPFLKTGSLEVRARAQAFYSLFDAWILNVADCVKVFNSNLMLSALNKSLVLTLARSVGLRIPETSVTNSRAQIGQIDAIGAAIAKPVTGGDYCRPLRDVLDKVEWREGSAPQPAFVQSRLDYPEYRVYRIGDRFVTFRVMSPALDYRSTSDYRIDYVPEGMPDKAVYQRLLVLADQLGITFGAIDLKTDPKHGEIVFLEINTMPMFAAYDRAADGALNDVILDQLGFE